VDLADLLNRAEGKTLEFKRDLSAPKGVLKSIVAFANTSGGVVLIGIEDGTRSVRGVDEPLDLEERLASLISDQIAPRPVPELEIMPWRGTHVLAVQVFPSPSRPHYLVREGRDEGVYVRVGSTNRRADAELIDELRRYARGEAYDEQPMPDLDSEAVDFRAASDSFARVRVLRRADLETLRLITPYQGRTVPTVGGVLLFGRDRERHFPDAWIQAGRFAGTDKSQILDHIESRSYLVNAVAEAIGFIQKHSLRGADIGPIYRTERWNIPPVAVREMVINAVTHADYRQRGAPIRIAIFDDRVEVDNPGLLPFGLTVDDLYRGISKLRNRVIGRVFHALGLIEHWGSGIQRMTAACIDAGLPPPVLEEIGTHFRVTLSTVRVEAPVLDPKDQEIMDALADDGMPTSEIAKVVQLTPRATRTRLAKLIERGFVRGVGSSPQDPKRRYFRAP
jgi:ATP-dependent DNA helicase RecG